MKTQRKCFLMFLSLFLMIFLLVGVAPLVLAQAQEGSEPNDSCENAQNFGQVVLPFIVEGDLGEKDVDFYQFTATPGTFIQVDLEGQSTGQGTLLDPFLGFFNSDCEQIAYNDDYFSLNSRLIIEVPSDGVLILAATACGDPNFNGEHGDQGTYRMTLSRFAAIGSISGSVVDQGTGIVLADAYVELQKCTDGNDPFTCYWVIGTNANSNGTFSFTTDSYGQQLSPGNYLVVASAGGYSANQFGPFEVVESQNYDVVNIKLLQIPSIGSISGRVVDAFTGVGLSGQDYPYAYMELSRCEEDYCYSVNGTTPDGEGHFTFVSDYWAQLPPGDYEVRAYAQEDYQTGLKAVYDVQDGEYRKIGDIALEPLPVQFSEKRPCGNLPKEGGTCKYSVRINNRSGKQLKGAAWSIVEGWNTGSLRGNTIFQTANPIKMTLRPGASRVVNFQFDVPSSVEDGASICVNVWFGENSNQPFFNTLKESNLLCIEKGETGFSLLAKKEAQKLLRDRHRPQTFQRSKKN